VVGDNKVKREVHNAYFLSTEHNTQGTFEKTLHSTFGWALNRVQSRTSSLIVLKTSTAAHSIV
jgi:hypothetical protein